MRKLLGIILVMLCTYPLSAQPSTDKGDTKVSTESVKSSPVVTKGLNRFSLWAGYSFKSATIIGETRNSTLGLMGINYSRKLFTYRKISFEYAADLNFFANYNYPEFNKENSRNVLQGLGFAPVGIQINFDDKRYVYPYLRSSGGFMIMEAPFPDNRGTKLNFIFEIGSGLEFAIAGNTHLFVGYKYHHLSNGETGQINPGIDSNLFYAGLTFFR